VGHVPKRTAHMGARPVGHVPKLSTTRTVGHVPKPNCITTEDN